MLVVTRYRVDDDRAGETSNGPRSGPEFRTSAAAALAALAERPGFVRGHVGRATDDPAAWVLVTEWVGVGAYRRALSAYEVKLHAVPLLSRAVDEPTAYEVLAAAGDVDPAHVDDDSRLAADAGSVGLGEAAAAEVVSDLGRGRVT